MYVLADSAGESPLLSVALSVRYQCSGKSVCVVAQSNGRESRGIRRRGCGEVDVEGGRMRVFQAVEAVFRAAKPDSEASRDAESTGSVKLHNESCIARAINATAP